MASHSGPSTPWKMAWRKSCRSTSTNGSSRLWSPTFVVSLRVRTNTFFMCSQRELTGGFPKNSSPEICREPWVYHFLGPRFFLQIPRHVLRRLSSSTLGTIILTGLPPSFSWFAKSFRALIKLSHIPHGAACACANLSPGLVCPSRPYAFCRNLLLPFPPCLNPVQCHRFLPSSHRGAQCQTACPLVLNTYSTSPEEHSSHLEKNALEEH